MTSYLYDGTIEGFYTCVFTAFERRETPDDIVSERGMQLALFGDPVPIAVDDDKAFRVERGLARRIGRDEAEHVKYAFLSDAAHREISILRYIQLAMREGRYAYCDHANPVVAEFEGLWRQVANERHAMIQFARFAEVGDGVYFSRINPKANVVPVLMNHFAMRFNTQRFVIYDEVHKVAGVYADGDWSLVVTDEIEVPEDTELEARCREMWKTFYDTICNQERLNPALRRSFMPKRLWRNITEMQP